MRLSNATMPQSFIRVAGLLLAASAAQAEVPLPPFCPEAESFSVVSVSEFPPMAVTGDRQRNQGVATDGTGWMFSATSVVERADESYNTTLIATIPPDAFVDPAYQGGTSLHYGNNHIGDLDTFEGKVYLAVEDGGTASAGPIGFNTPNYAYPIIAVYNAATMQYTGEKHHLDAKLHFDGVPWVAVDGPKRELITGEYDLPNNRLNIYKLDSFTFDRFLPLHYSPELGPGFHLSAVQGLKVYGSHYYASSTGAKPGVYRIDTTTGLVELAFAMPPTLQGEVEGLAFRPMADGSLLHLQQNHDGGPNNDENYSRLIHLARTCKKAEVTAAASSSTPSAPVTLIQAVPTGSAVDTPASSTAAGRFSGGAMGLGLLLPLMAFASRRRCIPAAVGAAGMHHC